MPNPYTSRSSRIFAVLSLAFAFSVVCELRVLSNDHQQQVPPGYVEIDGSKTPGGIPDYLAWEGAFRILRVAAKGPKRGVRSTLKLSTTDDVLVDAAVEAQSRRDAACEARQRRLVEQDTVAKTAAEDTFKRVYEIQIDCRQQTLDAADNLMARMSPEGRVELEVWVQARKRKIQALVVEKELPLFRLPR